MFRSLKSLLVGAFVWLTVGCGTAALVGTAAVLFWSFGFVIYYGAPVAVVFGAAQGLWVDWHVRRNLGASRLFWVFVGAMMGLAAFPLSFAMSDGTIRWWRVAIFVGGAVAGGAAGGYTTACTLTPNEQLNRPTKWRQVVFVAFACLVAAGLEFWMLWSRLDARLP